MFFKMALRQLHLETVFRGQLSIKMCLHKGLSSLVQHLTLHRVTLAKKIKIKIKNCKLKRGTKDSNINATAEASREEHSQAQTTGSCVTTILCREKGVNLPGRWKHALHALQVWNKAAKSCGSSGLCCAQSSWCGWECGCAAVPTRLCSPQCFAGGRRRRRRRQLPVLQGGMSLGRWDFAVCWWWVWFYCWLSCPRAAGAPRRSGMQWGAQRENSRDETKTKTKPKQNKKKNQQNNQKGKIKKDKIIIIIKKKASTASGMQGHRGERAQGTTAHVTETDRQTAPCRSDTSNITTPGPSLTSNLLLQVQYD